MSIKEIRKLLKGYGYTCRFEPLHKKSDISKYRHRQDAVNEERFLTFLDANKRIIGRLYHLKDEKSSLSRNDAEQIYRLFEIYRIPHVDQLLDELAKLAHLSVRGPRITPAPQKIRGAPSIK